MWTEEDLPDWDFASVYGWDALHARTLAWLDALDKSSADRTRRVEEILQELRQLNRGEAPQNTS